jgi:simple sugar transport system ATP-binding protein
MSLLQQLARKGTAIIFLTHHLREVMETCDSVTVMRQGKVVSTARTGDTSMQKLAGAMVGRAIGSDLGAVRVTHAPKSNKAAVLSIEALSVPTPDGSRMEIRDFSLTLHESELVAIVGVEGNGQDALMGALSGLRPHSGEIHSQGSALTQRSPRARIAHNISRIPGDRHTEGLSLTLPIWENLLLGRRQMWGLENRFGFISRRKAYALASDLISRFDIRVANLNVMARTASGGNQQKIVLARELSVSPSVVLAMNPTRGLDIASTNFVHGQLLSQAEQMAAVLLITSNLDEALTLAHRVLVLFRGVIVADYTPEFDRSEIGLAMGGVGIAI